MHIKLNKAIFTLLVIILSVNVLIPVYALTEDNASPLLSYQTYGLDSREDGFTVTIIIPELNAGMQNDNTNEFPDLILSNINLDENNGLPVSPTVNAYFIMPFEGGARVEIVESEYDIYSLDEFDNFTEDDTPADLSQNLERSLSGQIIEVGSPVIFHDLRIAPLRISPVKYNSSQGTIEFHHEMKISVTYTGNNQINTLDEPPAAMSRAFLPFYRTLLNWDEGELDRYETYHGCVQVVMRDDPGLLDAMQGWFDWKRQKGWKLTLLTDNDVDNWSRASIRGELSDRYEEAETKFDYVVVIGDATGAFSVPPGTAGIQGDYGAGDHGYTTLAGNDEFPDVSIGRISVENTMDAVKYVNKVLQYERTPYMDDTTWYRRGMVAAGSDVSGISTIYLCRYTRKLMLEAGYTRVDTAFYNDGLGPVNTRSQSRWNSGISFYLYRGLVGHGFQQANIQNLTNARKFPVALDITCNTGDWANSFSISEAYIRAGTINSPTGAIGAIATASSFTLTRLNNAMAGGAVFSAFSQRAPALGDLLTGAKLNLWVNYHSFEDELVTNFSTWINLMGDPLCWFWTDVPGTLQVSSPDTIELGKREFTVSVMGDDNPVKDAWVTLFKSDDMEDTVFHDLTGAAGEIYLDADFEYPGTAWLTVTSQNYAPYREEIAIIRPAARIGIDDYEVIDETNERLSGNGNGIPEAGETVAIRLTAINTGNEDQASVEMSVESDDQWLEILTSEASFRNIEAGGRVTAENDIIIAISPQAQNEWITSLEVTFSCEDERYQDSFPFRISAAQFEFVSLELSEPLEPGETSSLNVTLMNAGESNSESAMVTLSSHDVFLNILENEAELPAIDIGNTGMSGEFILSAIEESFPGHIAKARLIIETESGQVDTVRINITLGERGESDPAGPDNYGYYAFDDIDTEYDHAPVYSWIEINPDAEDSDFEGTLLELEDLDQAEEPEVVEELPFTFQYYGESFDEITISSNGFIAVGNQTGMPTYRNWTIPSPIGPDNMISPYWDDRRTSGDGGIYQYFDEEGGRYIIEWYAVTDFYNMNPCTFQLILFDHDEDHTTVTGDNEFLFQYKTMNHSSGEEEGNLYWTTGIENGDQTDGLLISYWSNSYPGSASVEDERAILFTTNTYDNIYSSIRSGETIPGEYRLYTPYPNPFNAQATVSFDLPQRTNVKLGIYNLLGRLVAVPVNKTYNAGNHEISLNAAEWVSGMYFVRLQAGSHFNGTVKMILVK
ncbi:MAG: C25 family cysteine peptidase [Candidatus Electryonea clarkiae]|nr:C25 family cysteine peptidase [Candidatus Electryonea clarkiae]MDP8286299.1 C25 family cysteine peptidase [Candidatus Electryonea clarkiae]